MRIISSSSSSRVVVIYDKMHSNYFLKYITKQIVIIYSSQNSLK